MILSQSDLSINRIFIGTYTGHASGNIPLCVSDSKDIIEIYMEITRNLDKAQYDIYETFLSPSDLMSLYEDLIIEISGDIPLPTRDWKVVYHESVDFIKSMENVYVYMRDFTNVIMDVKGMKTTAECLEEDLNDMLKIITDKKLQKQVYRSKIKQSIVFTPDIDKYLNHVKSIIEDRELMNEFMRKMQDNE